MFKALHRLSKASIGLGASLLMRFAFPLFGGLLGIGFFRVGHPSDPGGHSLMILIGYGIAIGLNHSKYVEALDLPLQCSEHPRPFRLASYYLLVDATVHVLTCFPFLILGTVLSTAPFQTAAIVAGLLALCVYGALMWYLKEFPVEEFFSRFRRGRTLHTMKHAAARALQITGPGERCFFWGGLRLPISCLGSHVCLVGASGSGKTTLIRLLMQDVLPPIAVETDSLPFTKDLERHNWPAELRRLIDE